MFQSLITYDDMYRYAVFHCNVISSNFAKTVNLSMSVSLKVGLKRCVCPDLSRQTIKLHHFVATYYVFIKQKLFSSF